MKNEKGSKNFPYPVRDDALKAASDNNILSKMTAKEDFQAHSENEPSQRSGAQSDGKRQILVSLWASWFRIIQKI